jgi:hypothetical protein
MVTLNNKFIFYSVLTLASAVDLDGAVKVNKLTYDGKQTQGIEIIIDNFCQAKWPPIDFFPRCSKIILFHLFIQTENYISNTDNYFFNIGN